MRYTVISTSSGEVVDTGLTALQALDELLSHDGRDWKFTRASNGLLSLWHTAADRQRMVRMLPASYLPGIAGQREIAEEVLRNSRDWPRVPLYVITDADFDRMAADTVGSD